MEVVNFDDLVERSQASISHMALPSMWARFHITGTAKLLSTLRVFGEVDVAKESILIATESFLLKDEGVR